MWIWVRVVSFWFLSFTLTIGGIKTVKKGEYTGREEKKEEKPGLEVGSMLATYLVGWRADGWSSVAIPESPKPPAPLHSKSDASPAHQQPTSQSFPRTASDVIREALWGTA